jgi:hypothetical protein
MDKDNLNPTILSASQLPTRQPKTKRDSFIGEASKFKELRDYVVQRPSYLSKPFYDDSWSDDTGSDDGLTYEPIDEQEIYGMSIWPDIGSYDLCHSKRLTFSRLDIPHI